VFRRKRDETSSTEPFVAVLNVVEAAKAELMTAVPSPRGVPARPLAEALLSFEEGLRAARQAMTGRDLPEAVRSTCAEAIDDAQARAERLRLDAPVLDYEGLVAVLGDLIEPLDAFAEAERSLAT
jgi:hypothetical protein